MNRSLLTLALLLGMAATASASGDGGHAAVETPPPAPEFALGEPIKGFDVHVLRSARHLHELRFPIKGLGSMTVGAKPRNVALDIVIEFGRESGMAEMKENEKFLRGVLNDLIGRFSFSQLLSVEGKLALKEDIIGAINERFSTASVRQVYIVGFTLSSPRD